VSGCAEDTREMCARRPALFGISTLPSGTMGISILPTAGKPFQPSSKTKMSVQT